MPASDDDTSGHDHRHWSMKTSAYYHFVRSHRYTVLSCTWFSAKMSQNRLGASTSLDSRNELAKAEIQCPAYGSLHPACRVTKLPCTVPIIRLYSRARGRCARWQPETHKAHLVEPRRVWSRQQKGVEVRHPCALEQEWKRHQPTDRAVRTDIARSCCGYYYKTEASALLAVVRAPNPGSVVKATMPLAAPSQRGQFEFSTRPRPAPDDGSLGAGPVSGRARVNGPPVLSLSKTSTPSCASCLDTGPPGSRLAVSTNPRRDVKLKARHTESVRRALRCHFASQCPACRLSLSLSLSLPLFPLLFIFAEFGSVQFWLHSLLLTLPCLEALSVSFNFHPAFNPLP